MAKRREKKERRNPSERRNHRARKRESSRRIAVVELAHRELRVVVLDRSDNDNPDRARAVTFTWNESDVPLHSPEGFKLLTAAFKRLGSEYSLQGVGLNIVLSGEFCITRALRGVSDVVRFELQRMEKRSRMYLSLGPGEKVVVSCEKPLDARHVRALAATCNAKTLDTVYQASERAGLQIETIEPALVAVASAIHRLPEEPDEPYMVVHFDHSTAEIGVCSEGQLLLDYRPGGCTDVSYLVELIQQHRKRLERHTARQLGIAPPRLKFVFLCGNQQAIAEASRLFAADDSFHAIVVDPNAIQASWEFPEGTNEPTMIPALGALLSTYLPMAEREAPDFMQHVLASTREPLSPTLIRSALPFAATLLLALGMLIFNLSRQGRSDSLREQIDALAPIAAEFRELKLGLVRSETKSKEMKTLAAGLHALPASAVLERLGHCMPNDVWLQKLQIDDMQVLQLTGITFQETGVYDFVRWLERAPGFKEVALLGTRSSRTETGPAVGFELELSLKNLSTENTTPPTRRVASNE